MFDDGVKVSLFLDEDLLGCLREYCDVNNVTISQAIRQILNEYLDKWFLDNGY